MIRKLMRFTTLFVGVALVVGGVVYFVILNVDRSETGTPGRRTEGDVQGDSGPSRPTGGRISGRVLARPDQRPVPGATVVLDFRGSEQNPDARSATDENGYFELKGLPAGEYTLTANHERLVAEIPLHHLALGEQQRLSEETLIMKSGLDVLGRIVDSETGEPVASAEVSYRIQPREWSALYPGGQRFTSTGPEGQYRVTGLVDAYHDLSVRAPGFLKTDLMNRLVDTHGQRIDVNLEPGGTISGRVVGPSDQPVPGATVEIESSVPSGEKHPPLDETKTSTDSEGRYRLSGLPVTATYLLIANHKGHALACVERIKFQRGRKDKQVDIRLAPERSIRGRVLNEQGRPIRGAIVTAEVETCGIDTITPEARIVARFEHLQATSGEQGEYEIGGMKGQCYEISAECKGYLPAGRDLYGHASGGFTTFGMTEKGYGGIPVDVLDLYLLERRSVRGTVRDSEGNAVAGVRISPLEEASRAIPDETGQFVLQDLSRRTSTILVETTDWQQFFFAWEPSAKEIDLVLSSPAVIRGHVRAAPHGDLSTARVRARGPGDHWGTAQCQPDGSFELTIPGGSYELTATMDGRAPSRPLVVVLKPGEHREGIALNLAPTARIVGTARWHGTNRPVTAGSVYFRPEENVGICRDVAPGPDGRFDMANLPPGPFNLEVRSPAGRLYSTTVSNGHALEAGEVRKLLVEIVKKDAVQYATLSGSLSEGGKLPDLRLKELRVGLASQGKVVQQKLLDANSRFSFERLSPGFYTAIVSEFQRSDQPFFYEKTIRIRVPGTVDLKFEEPKRVRVQGIVRRAGVPLADLAIAVTDHNSHLASREFTQTKPRAFTKTRPDGRYKLDLIRRRRYGIWLWYEGERHRTKVDVDLSRASEQQPLDIALPAEGVKGLIVEEGSVLPVDGVQIELFRRREPLRSMFALNQARQGIAWSDYLGRFAIPHLPPGAYSVRVVDKDYGHVWLPAITVEADKTSSARLGLKRCVRPPAVEVSDPHGYETSRMVLVRTDKGDVVVDPTPAGVGLGSQLLLPPLATGIYELTLVSPQYPPLRVPLDVRIGSPGRILSFEKGGSLDVSVQDAQAKPIPGVNVTLINANGHSVFDDRVPFSEHNLVTVFYPPLLTAQDGSLLLDALNPGSYRVFATTTGNRTPAAVVVIRRDEVARITLVMP